MDTTWLRRWARYAADWAADYRAGVRERPVRAQTLPGSIFAALPQLAPEQPEPMEAIFADLDRLILPGITHWQHPRFFAYFPANASPPSVVAEIVTAALAAQCMLWQTSPAASELETRVLDWLRRLVGLPGGFTGVIQDSATTATFAALLTARERALGFSANRTGLSGQPALRVYASAQTHSSVDKAVRMAGIGSDNLIRIPTSGPLHGLDLEALQAAIERDLAAGLKPAAVVACLGGTSIGACDDIAGVVAVAERYGLYVHVDGAWAGAAMICPEFRHLMAGVEGADSFVFNPHKWLFTHFDCTAHFVRDPKALAATLGLKPAYLATPGAAEAIPGVVDYNEMSVPLGRRFRALKLWFVLRSYGAEALRQKIRDHVAWAERLAAELGAEPDFDIVTAPVLSLFSFRYAPPGLDEGQTDRLNTQLVQALNDDGRIYLTQSVHEGRVVIRFSVGQTDTTWDDVALAGRVIHEVARSLPRVA